MATPTTFFGLQKAADGENYDLDLTNLNLDAIDLGLVKINTVSGTYNLNGITGTNSRFTRVRIGASNVGFVIAEFGVDIDTSSITIAAGTAAPTVLPDFIPAGYRPKFVSHSIPMRGRAPVTNAGSSAALQWGFNTSGDLLLRSETTGTYTTVTGTDMNMHAVYEWGGS